MTTEVWPFGPVDVTSDQYSRLFYAVSSPGTVSGLAVSAVSGQMKVSVAAGRAIINGFSFESTTATQLDIDSNSTGDVRLDVVIAELSALFETFELAVLTGYSSEDLPYISTEPQGLTQIPLAIIAVPDGATAITAGMITAHQQHIASGYDIVDNVAKLPADGHMALDTNAALVYLRGDGLWSDWNQQIDASQVTSGRISADRMPFAPEQVIVNDIGDKLSPAFISSKNNWGWTGTPGASTYVSQFAGQGININNGAKLGSSSTTPALIGVSDIQASRTSAPTDPNEVSKWSAGRWTVGTVDLRVFLPSIKLVNNAWTGTTATVRVDIVNPFTNIVKSTTTVVLPYRQYNNTSNYQESVWVTVPFACTTDWAVQVKVYGWKTISGSGNDGYLDAIQYAYTTLQNPFAEVS